MKREGSGSRLCTILSTRRTHLLLCPRLSQDNIPSPAMYKEEIIKIQLLSFHNDHRVATNLVTYPAVHILEITTLVVDTVVMFSVLKKLDFLQDVLPFLHNTHQRQQLRSQSIHIYTLTHLYKLTTPIPLTHTGHSSMSPSLPLPCQLPHITPRPPVHRHQRPHTFNTSHTQTGERKTLQTHTLTNSKAAA